MPHIHERNIRDLLPGLQSNLRVVEGYSAYVEALVRMMHSPVTPGNLAERKKIVRQLLEHGKAAQEAADRLNRTVHQLNRDIENHAFKEVA